MDTQRITGELVARAEAAGRKATEVVAAGEEAVLDSDVAVQPEDVTLDEAE